MAFTRDELLRGAIAAWAIFMALLLIATTLLVGASSLLPGWSSSALDAIPLVLGADGIVLVVGGAISATVMALGLPVVRSLATRLRREPRIPVHVLVYTALGAAIGILLFIAVHAAVGTFAITWLDAVIALPALFSTVAVPLGWGIAVRSALRSDRGIRQRSLPDPDADFEDDAVSSAGREARR